MAKKQVYSFVERKYSANGVASVLLGVGSFLVLALVLLISFRMKGGAGAWIGAVGFTGAVMALLGLRYGFLGFRDECRSQLCSRLGAVVSALSVAGWFFVVCIGIAALM